MRTYSRTYIIKQENAYAFCMVITAASLACVGIVINRFVMTIQTLALPTLPFDQFLSYVPSWQEVATFLAVLAYGCWCIHYHSDI